MKQVVVTGGTRGIGAEVSDALAGRGWSVIATGVDDSEVAAFLADHAESNIRAQTLDVRNNLDVTSVFQRTGRS